MPPVPQEILLPSGDELAVLWEDGHESFYPAALLRRECPCASCRTRRAGEQAAGPLRIVNGASVGSPPRIARWELVGRYAVNIVWTDGHRTGIYPFVLLRGLCPCDACRRSRQP